ncbi:hypothetical protein BC937DRAFT_88942 [Endogone sp. FLAS-F59071]|nr:hypothetical protein BC937DRAFT_88942 [Endogone sp. FLAS-F59071]|eukprot:RUS18304.1 hypothetical protein BC937DRAFT_88942 [Endogone sp. FLAS-F59071]
MLGVYLPSPISPHGYDVFFTNDSATSSHSSANESANSASFGTYPSITSINEPLTIFAPNVAMFQPYQSSHFDSQASSLDSDGALYLDNLLEESTENYPQATENYPQATENYPQATENYPQATNNVASVSTRLSDRRSCDLCSYKKVRCSGSFPCQRCTAKHKNCTTLPSRKKNPGTCKECAIQNIRCVGKGDVCFACKIRETSCIPIPKSRKRNLARDDKFSKDPFGKHGGKDDSNNNKGR